MVVVVGAEVVVFVDFDGGDSGNIVLAPTVASTSAAGVTASITGWEPLFEVLV